PVKLVAANALLRGAQKEHRLQPDMQRDMAGLEDSADLDGKGLAAVVALVDAYAGALARQLAAVIHSAAMRADAAFPPYAALDKIICGLFVVEVGGVEYRHDNLLLANT